MNEKRALEELSHKVWEERRIVTYLLFKLTVAKLLLASDERRFVADALAEVDKTVEMLRSWEDRRDEALRDLADVWRVDPATLSLPELARRSPPPFDYTFSEHLQAFQQLAEEIDEVTEQNRTLAGTSYAEVTQTIEMMTGPPPETTTTTYDAYGQLGASELVGRRLREAL
ncbi:MAG: flagellar export chaperone FlgN [Nitriliruptoraceae bacterium]